MNNKSNGTTSCGPCGTIVVLGVVFVAAIIFGSLSSNRWHQLKLMEKHERLLDREILRSIYAQQKFPLFNNDGLQIKPFAQGILKQIGELIFFEMHVWVPMYQNAFVSFQRMLKTTPQSKNKNT